MIEDFDMLAATLVHEIKNPLALVRANLDYIELCDTEKRYANSYTIMKRQLERTDSLLQDFVGLVSGVCADSLVSRRETILRAQDFYPVHCERTDICAAIKGASDDYIAKPGLQIELNLPPKLIACGNEKLLRIVFSNAIKNAVEANAHHIYICAEQKNKRTYVTVTDDGTGLTDEVIKNVGESGGYTTKKYGNGLGVLISRRIIAKYGGGYRIGNAEKGGCVVKIDLPC